MTIATWPISERPREKLLTLGPKYLSDAELLAIFLRTGTRGKTAIDLARELLGEFGNLKKLLTASPGTFYKKSGIGKAKLAILKAALELGRRHAEETLEIGETLKNSQTTKRFLGSRLRDYSHEVFACLFLDSAHHVIAFDELFQGTLTEANVYPREVIKRCLEHNAAKVILAHNHPSGNPTPSDADQQMTRLLKESLALVDIQVIDHIVIGLRETFSFAEAGLIYYNKRLQEEIINLPDTLLARYVRLTDLMQKYGPDIGMPHTKSFGNGLFELRLKGKEGIARVFYCTRIGKIIYMLHCFIKKTEKTPLKDIYLAKKRLLEVKRICQKITNN
jgi:DNA repair protein RadC